MKTSYIPKQEKQVKERFETKLDRPVLRKFEAYCRYLESDRDYVITQILEVTFKKDKGFEEWLGAHPIPPDVQ